MTTQVGWFSSNSLDIFFSQPVLSSDILLISLSVFADNLLDALTVDDVVAISLSYPGFDVLLGATVGPKIDVFLENFQTALTPPRPFLEITLRFFSRKSVKCA